MGRMLNLTTDGIIKALSAFQLRPDQRHAGLFMPDAYRTMRRAAVLIPLLIYENKWHLLLTRRSDELVEHRGQVAFPGGAQEEQDANLQDTALREMNEEIGVLPEDVQVLGSLGDIPVITNYLVSLFVGQISWPYPLKINSKEVNSIFIVPLQWLVDKNHHTVAFRSYEGKNIPVVYFDLYKGQQLWGVSAEMTLALLSALGVDQQ